MAAMQFATHWTAVLASTTSTVAVGTVLVRVPASDTYIVASTANRSTQTPYLRADCIAISAGDSTNRSVSVQAYGPIDTSITGLTAGSASWVRVSATGTLERVTTPSGNDDVVGWAEDDGLFHAHFATLTVAIITAASGGVAAGSTTELQYNLAGALTGAANLTYVGGFLTVATDLKLASGGFTTRLAGGGATATITLPAATCTLVGRDTTDTLSSKTLTTPAIWNAALTFKYTVVGAALLGNYNLNLPLLSTDDTLVVLDHNQTLTNKTLTAPVLQAPRISNPAHTFSYIFAGDAIVATRTLLLPLLTGNDTVVTEAHNQTLTNKTLSSPTISTPSIATPTISGTTTWTGAAMQATGNLRCQAFSAIANVQTTDATVTSLYTWTILDEAVTLATAEVGASLSTGADTAAYVRRIKFKRDGGTVTAGTVETTFSDESVAGWDATIDNSTSTGRVRVTGVIATTIDWGGVATRLEVSHA